MAARAKRIDLKSIPGATAQGIKWMMSTGVRTEAQARSAAGTFVKDFEKTKTAINSLRKKRPS